MIKFLKLSFVFTLLLTFSFSCKDTTDGGKKVGYKTEKYEIDNYVVTIYDKTGDSDGGVYNMKFEYPAKDSLYSSGKCKDRTEITINHYSILHVSKALVVGHKKHMQDYDADNEDFDPCDFDFWIPAEN